jgi:hypothetical protein
MGEHAASTAHFIVRLTDLHGGSFENDLFKLRGYLNGTPVVLEVTPHDTWKGVCEAQKALLGTVFPWCIPPAQHVTPPRAGDEPASVSSRRP